MRNFRSWLAALIALVFATTMGAASAQNVKSFDLLVVEHSLKAVLRPYEAPFWLYHAARDYTGRTDELIPRSAPMVEDIAGFWRKHFGIKR